MTMIPSSLLSLAGVFDLSTLPKELSCLSFLTLSSSHCPLFVLDRAPSLSLNDLLLQQPHLLLFLSLHLYPVSAWDSHLHSPLGMGVHR